MNPRLTAVCMYAAQNSCRLVSCSGSLLMVLSSRVCPGAAGQGEGPRSQDACYRTSEKVESDLAVKSSYLTKGVNECAVKVYWVNSVLLARHVHIAYAL